MTRSNEELPENELDFAMKSCLEEAFRVPKIKQDALKAIREVAYKEWRQVHAQSVAYRRRRLVVLAASILLAVLGVAFWWGPPVDNVEFGRVIRADAGGLEDRSKVFERSLLGVNSKLYVGQAIQAKGPALIDVGHEATIRVASGSLFCLRDLRTLELIRGQVYLEFPSGTTAGPRLGVVTSAGRIEHLGTQFEVMTFNGQTRVRVREGRVRFVGTAGPVVAGQGTQLDIGATGAVSRKVVDTQGRDWAWAESLAPDYVLDRRHLVDFLQWVARETGRHVDFADERARKTAESTELHGSLHGMTPLEALARVVSTTSLRYQLQDHSIRVFSGE